MAIQLSEGGYALAQHSAEKIVFQVKLTDSALKAFGEYQNLKTKIQRPNIRFDGNQGSIDIPVGSNGEVQSFTFQLAALNKCAAIDCLQQFEVRESLGKVSVLGGMQQKITVNANDDTYNATRKRMTLVKEQEQKSSTKVIKDLSYGKSGKSKILRRRVLDPGHSTYNQRRHPTPPPSRSNFNRPSSPHTTSSQHTTSSLRSESPLSSGKDLAGVRNKTKPILSSVTGVSSISPSAPTSDVMSKTLLDAVVHHLAPKPLKQQELVMRLTRNAMIHDAGMLSSTLRQVATARTVGKGEEEYTLMKQRYNDVKIDWPHYTEEDRAILRKKFAEVKLPTPEGRKRPPELPPSSPPQRRSAEEETSYTNPVKKKQRVSLYSKTSPTSSKGNKARTVSPFESVPGKLNLTSSAPGITSSSVVKLSVSDIAGLDIVEPPSSLQLSPKKSRRDDNLTNTSQPLPSHPRRSTPPPTKKKSSSSGNTNSSTLTSHSKTKKNTKVNLAAEPVAEDEQTDEFIKKYKTIQFSEECSRYKKDFALEYKEYLLLHEKVATQSKRFAEWQRQISKQERGTETYKNIARQVFEEYKRLKKDVTFSKDRERVDYLHRKLKHIKDLVLEYDARQSLSSNNHNRPRDGAVAGRQTGRSESGNSRHKTTDVVHKRSLLTA